MSLNWNKSKYLSQKSRQFLENNPESVEIVDNIIKEVFFHDVNIGTDVKLMFYHEISKILKPFDIVLFSGAELVSSTIKLVQATQTNDEKEKKYGLWSHVGVVVNTAVMDINNGKEGEWYVLEITASGALLMDETIDMMTNTGGIKVQVRNLQDVVKTYGGNVGHVALCENPIVKSVKETIEEHEKRILEIKKIVNNFYNKHKDKSYQYNPIQLFSSVFSFLRPSRKVFPISKHWIMCSQLCAMLYQDLKILPQNLKSENVIPTDFVFQDKDEIGIPYNLFQKPPNQIIKQIF